MRAWERAMGNGIHDAITNLNEDPRSRLASRARSCRARAPRSPLRVRQSRILFIDRITMTDNVTIPRTEYKYDGRGSVVAAATNGRRYIIRGLIFQDRIVHKPLGDE
jgi:hypothetical protein